MYDEPTAGLDPVASTVVEDLIRSLQVTDPVGSNGAGPRAGIASYIVVTHQHSTIRRAVDRLIFLHEVRAHNVIAYVDVHASPARSRPGGHRADPGRGRRTLAEPEQTQRWTAGQQAHACCLSPLLQGQTSSTSLCLTCQRLQQF